MKIESLVSAIDAGFENNDMVEIDREEWQTLKSAVEIANSAQHTQPAKCRDCYHWLYATKACCSRGGGNLCVIKGGTQQAGA